MHQNLIRLITRFGENWESSIIEYFGSHYYEISSQMFHILT